MALVKPVQANIITNVHLAILTKLGFITQVHLHVIVYKIASMILLQQILMSVNAPLVII